MSEITQREMFLSKLNREESKPVPFFPRDLTLGMDALGVKTTEIFSEEYNTKLSVECVLALQEKIGHDAIVGAINSYGLQVFGGEMKYPADGIPYLSKPPFADIEKMDNYSPDQIRDHILDGIRKSYEIVRRKREDLAVVMNVGGPVNTAGNLRGIETFIMDTAINPDLAQKATDFGAEIMMSIIDFIGFDNCDCVFLASASDNPDMLGPDEFKKYSLPKVKRCAEHVHENGSKVIYHPHGLFSTEERRKLLADCVSTGIDGFQFAENNIPGDILKETKGKCCILGGVDAFTTLLIGPDERIRKDVNAFLDVLGNEDYIMTCSCSLNRGMPIRNIQILAQTVRDYNKRSE